MLRLDVLQQPTIFKKKQMGAKFRMAGSVRNNDLDFPQGTFEFHKQGNMHKHVPNSACVLRAPMLIHSAHIGKALEKKHNSSAC